MDNYEKKYKETLERAREIYNDSFFNEGVSGHNLMERLFPELRESEDEKIKKALINYFDNANKSDENPLMQYGIQTDKVITWLEKQGEQKSTHNLNSQEAMDIAVEKCFDEQKSANKVEPKFKVGDWVVNNTTRELCHIVKVEHGQYVCSDCSFPITKENEYHFWTIADAKDGDVLVSDNGVIILVKESRDSSWGYRLSYYCVVLYNGTFEPREFHVNSEKFFPATKEQRDTLFAKMKDAGYTFDFDKKELKKIVVPIFSIGDTITTKHNPTTNKIYFTITDIISGKYWYNDRIICDISEQDEWELVEQKSTWSEEDEEKLGNAIFACINTYGKNSDSAIWLTSLKQRMEKEK